MKRKLSHTDIVRNARKDIDEILTELESMLLPTTLRSNTVANRKSETPVVSLPNQGNPDANAKARVINWFKKGKTVSQIADKFPMFTSRQLSAIKAHVTMGTY